MALSIFAFEKRKEVDLDSKRQKTKEFSRRYWIVLLSIILGFYLISGIMYSLVYPGWFAAQEYSAAIANFFYMIAAVAAGYCIDRFERKYAVLLALSLVGLGYFGLIIFSSYTFNIICISLLQIGSAFMDIFVFITLSEIASFENHPSRKIGLGLSANVFSIFIANLILYQYGASVQALNNIKYIGVGLVFILIPVSALLKEKVVWRNVSVKKLHNICIGKENTEAIEKETAEAIAELNPESVLKKYHLTSRETEIAMCLFDGKSFQEIEEGLGIKNTTVKTHMKKIYNKTNTNSQKDLVLLVLKEIRQR